MNLRKLPPLHALAAFESVARHSSFTRAAGELCLTHSAVSQRIGTLEEQLSTKLFNRSNRRVALTSAGRQYLEEVSAALQSLGTATERLRGNERASVRLSVALAFATHWLAPRLPAFHARHPGIDLDIQCSNGLVDLRAGEADVGLRWGGGQWPGLRAIRILSGDLFPVCSPDYRKARGGIRRRADLARTTLLRHTVLQWSSWLRHAGLDWPEPGRGPLFNDSTLMLHAAADGQGVALTRRVFADSWLKSGRLVKLFDVEIVEEQAFYAVYAGQVLSCAAVARFVAWLKEQAQLPATARAIDRAVP